MNDFSQKLFSLLGLAVLSPIFIICILLIATINAMSPFYKQQRAGKHGKIFTLYKFQTIKRGKVTILGAILRSSGLDEIPQLFNVILGDMSFVGPRPLLPEYLPHYSDFENRRHQIKPGITGLAQVGGGKTLSWEHQFRYDVFYVRNRCFRLDLLILCLTLKSIVNKDRSKVFEERKWTRPAISQLS